MFSKMRPEKAASFLLPGDEVLGVITGQWKTGFEVGTAVAFLAGGLLVAGLVSRSGETGWIIVSHNGLLAIGAGKVAGGPDVIVAAAPAGTRLALKGPKENRLTVGTMDLAVRKQDLVLARELLAPPPGYPESADGFWPAPPVKNARLLPPPSIPPNAPPPPHAYPPPPAYPPQDGWGPQGTQAPPG